ncbi:MAG: glycosyltransferase family 4 protein [Pseudomonadota bacterium]|nr:glycosyltransferase family 4 protein [Pseudomonadota bacterium]
MKLAIIRQRYTPFGGAERFLERALAALRLDDLEITVIARDWPKGSQSEYQRVLVKPFAIGRAWRDAAFSRAACRAVTQGQFDLVQSHERLTCCDLFRAGDGVHREWLTQRARRRGLLTRALDRLSPFHRRLLSAEQAMFSSPRLRAVICNSRMVRDEIVRYYGVDPHRLHVIPNGVDTQVFHPGLRALHRAALRQKLGIADDHPLFLFVGSGFERKGVDLLLDVWPDLEQNVHLALVGHDRRVDRYRRRAESLGLAERVHFAGPQQDVGPWYGAADAFVLPTLYDPLPNAALEALSCGLPLLTSGKSGAAELIEDGINGDVRDALDRNGWREILRAWSDQGRCAAAGGHARQAVESLTLDAMQDRFQTLYTQLLSRS